MAIVKIKFSIEIDNESFVSHAVEYQSMYEQRRPWDTNEERLAVETINKMNSLTVENNLKLKDWNQLFVNNQ
ncbi:MULTISPECIES: hypothetical protein [Pasteurellaceae]|uniref:Uncharacterized protein n=1 Tax=Haemophilus influenzae TaxID=727 RepID=A0AAX3ISR9_HAEIF|nr:MULTISPECIES: hypothetical protein [Pasteurellaceae]MDC2825682.1 hypothetical protein [Rodentibacter pneumotropicus]RFN96288.1 hypothetical protein CH638_03485 [Haemophilus influenzae]VTX59807.1 Uncharacterised protein [Haemophilus influenzae]